MDIALGTVVGGKYRIEKALARGGMGSVWIARHVQLGSTMAIKFLDPSFAASAAHRARFEREARSAANLKSPHVVHVQDYGFEGDAPYIVMELLEGEDLNQRLHRVRRMNLNETAKVLVQVGKALKKAHEAGIAHRDLKPANLFIARVDDDEVVKVLDFGIAKEQHAAAGDATRTGEVIGSPHYMSPEQVKAEKDLDHRTDLWSLGIILFRMLVGTLPFPGDQLGPVLAKILTDPIPVPSQYVPDLPRTMDGFFMRALARDKNQRFQSIQEMVEAFQAAAGGREALPSISMSLGTGPVGAGGTALWTGPGQGPVTNAGPLANSGPLAGSGPMGASGPLGASAPYAAAATASHTGPVTAGGLVSTGSAPKPKSNAGLVIGVIGVLLAAGVGAGVFFMLRAPAGDASAAQVSTATPTALTTTSAAPTVAATATAEPTVAASASAAPTASASAPPTSTGPTTKPTGKINTTGPTPKPKEKWF
ncbi:MAG: serine/threonine protein kinase [Polyangiaceae bacterium]|nr:serine/threonine protein kinase [Polyangiaceae bacterium]